MADDKKVSEGSTTQSQPVLGASAEPEHVQMVQNPKAEIEPRTVDFSQDGEPLWHGPIIKEG